MKIFSCQKCNNTVYFENTQCQTCQAALGFLPGYQNMSALEPVDGGWHAHIQCQSPRGKQHPVTYLYCANHAHGACNWLVVKSVDNAEGLCVACRLNRHIPNLSDDKRQQEWQALERAKHRLVYSLLRLQLPLTSKQQAPVAGLSFDFISEEDVVPADAAVTTGHAEGQITINADEADSPEREQRRVDMGENYRTLIGHFRHEVGHYYWEVLVRDDPQRLTDCRALFGDERADYQQALQQHYENGAPQDWQQQFVSSYASAHPWEDWAETWAHYLHMVDALETAYAFGISISPPHQQGDSMSMAATLDPYAHDDMNEIIDQHLRLAFAINSINRSMGQPDLYPFVITPPIRAKLVFIHRLVSNSRRQKIPIEAG